MTTITALPRSRDGKLQLPGREEIVLNDVSFATLSAIPPAVTVSGGTLAGAAPSATLRLTTSTTQYSTASAALPAVTTTDWQWLKLTLEITIPATGPTPAGSIEFAGTGTIGAKWVHSTKAINSRVGSPDVDLVCNTYMHRQLEGRVMRRKVAFLIIPSKQIIAALDGDQGVAAAAVFPTMTGGSVTPKLTVQTTSAAASTLDIRRIALIGGR
jgi:hypothetical protein